MFIIIINIRYEWMNDWVIDNHQGMFNRILLVGQW